MLLPSAHKHTQGPGQVVVNNIYRCYPLPPPLHPSKKLGFARISWVVLLEAEGARTLLPVRCRPCTLLFCPGLENLSEKPRFYRLLNKLFKNPQKSIL